MGADLANLSGLRTAISATVLIIAGCSSPHQNAECVVRLTSSDVSGRDVRAFFSDYARRHNLSYGETLSTIAPTVVVSLTGAKFSIIAQNTQSASQYTIGVFPERGWDDNASVCEGLETELSETFVRQVGFLAPVTRGP